MTKKHHIRILIIASMVWFMFFLLGLPDYYLQYSTKPMVIFVITLLIPISIIFIIIIQKIRPKNRMSTALWYAFYFTVILAFYDSLYCGIYLGYGMGFLWVFWFLSIYYVIPWMLFPFIVILLNRRNA